MMKLGIVKTKLPADLTETIHVTITQLQRIKKHHISYSLIK